MKYYNLLFILILFVYSCGDDPISPQDDSYYKNWDNNSGRIWNQDLSIYAQEQLNINLEEQNCEISESVKNKIISKFKPYKLYIEIGTYDPKSSLQSYTFKRCNFLSIDSTDFSDPDKQYYRFNYYVSFAYSSNKFCGIKMDILK